MAFPKWLKISAAVLGAVGASAGGAIFAAGASTAGSRAHETRQDERLTEHDASFTKIGERLDGKEGQGGIRGQLEAIDKKVDGLRIILNERLPARASMGD